MATVIETRDLSRVYKVPQLAPGIKGKLASLFSRTYKDVKALDGLNLSVESGEFVGYVGPNGAGKSTTIKLLAGILWPSAGSVRVLGRDPHRQRVANAQNIAAVLGWRSILPGGGMHLPVIDSFLVLKQLYSVPERAFNENLRMVEECLGMKELWRKPFRVLSQGQWMRCSAAAPFMTNPKIIYLDEPTIAMDALIKDAYRKLLLKVNRERKTTILLATHDLRDIEELCSRVLVIDKGRIIYDGSLSRLKGLYGEYRNARFKLKTRATGPISIGLPKDAVETVQADGDSLSVRFDKAKISARKVMDAVFENYEVEDVTIQEPGIEAVIQWIYKQPRS